MEVLEFYGLDSIDPEYAKMVSLLGAWVEEVRSTSSSALSPRANAMLDHIDAERSRLCCKLRPERRGTGPEQPEEGSEKCLKEQ